VFSVRKQIFSHQILFVKNYLQANIFETKNGGSFCFGETSDWNTIFDGRRKNIYEFHMSRWTLRIAN